MNTRPVNKGFRVSGDELTDGAALDAMELAVGVIERAALDARLELLHLGFSDEHNLVKQLDKTAAEYANVGMVCRRLRKELNL